MSIIRLVVGLITVGFLFILFSVFVYLKVVNSVGISYKITKVSKKINVLVLGLMISFLSSYLLILLEVFFGKIKISATLIFVSVLLCSVGIFVYAVIFLLKKLFENTEKIHLKSINGLINIFELRDEYTRGHSEDVALLSERIYDNLPKKLKNKVSKNELIMSALLHDIGKIIIPEKILNKKGSLTKEEYAHMKEHADYSGCILKAFEIFEDLSEIVKYHHERVDGKGYFSKVKEDIPLESRIIAVADVYSAVTTKRVYREKGSEESALELLKSISGTQLDSEIVDVFVKIMEKELGISKEKNESLEKKKEARLRLG